MNLYKSQKNKGFTLIEMLVSIALFSIVLVVSLGSIITIIDTNRKSQTLTLVMNNMNFALESMTRTIKTATDINDSVPAFKEQVDEDGNGGNWIKYTENTGTIKKCTDSGSGYVCSPIISSNVEISDFDIEVKYQGDDSLDNPQWRVFIYLEGVAELSPRVSTDFQIQTTVSPRNLNL